jgi:hypothetical protein
MENGISLIQNNALRIGQSDPQPKWIKINDYTFINDVSGDIWINIENLYPPKFKKILEMIFDEREKAYVLDTVWALKDKESSRNYFIQICTEKYQSKLEEENNGNK